MNEKQHQLCRLCAENKSGLVGIYDVEGRNLEMESKIAKCLHILVFVNDCLPLSVCHECWALLKQFNDFYEKTNQAQNNLRRMLINSKETSQSTLVPNVESNFVEKTRETSKGEEYIEVEVDLVARGNEDDEEYFDSGENNDSTEKLSEENVKDEKGQKNEKQVKRKSSVKQAYEDAKKARNCGLNGKAVDGNPIFKKEIGPGCDFSCRFKCQTKVTCEERVQLFEEFWGIGNHSLQWSYIDKMIVSNEPQKRLPHLEHKEDSKKKFSHQCFLVVGMKNQKVCRKMFLDTFGISNAWIRTISKKKSNSQDGEFILRDMRGKHHNKPKRIPAAIRDSVHEHIQSFPKIESHYCGLTTQKEYLDETLNVKKMYTLYQNWMESMGRKDIATEHYYRHTFNTSYDLSFHKPKKDQCEMSKTYKYENQESLQTNMETDNVKALQSAMDQPFIPPQQYHDFYTQI